MKTQNPFKLVALAAVAAVALLSACSKQSEPTAHDDHAGHKHGKTEASADDKAVAAGPKCAAHGAPKTLCFICDASLREKGRLWCKEHNRYEDRCWQCHPDQQDKNRLWCKEHSLYEDECFLCRPELKAKGKAGGNPAPGGSVLMCKEHGVPETECGICRPELAGKLKPGEGAKVRLVSNESAGIAGVQTATPSVGTIADAVECYAELTFNQNKLAQIAAPVGGIVQAVEADLGSKVEEKQCVANIWSAALAEAVAKAVLTHQTLDRERKLRADRVTSEKDLQQAEAEHRSACQQARTLGFSEEDIDRMRGKPNDPVYLEVRAPFAGEIVERTAVRGALVDAGKPLFTLADRSVMWAMLNIPESALARVQVGQTVELRVESLPGQTFTGKLTWIGAEVDDKSRMARARAEVANPDGLLKARMFAQARILTRNAEGAVLLPPSAIQRVEGNSFVFVKLADDLFDARAVRLGAKFDGKVEIIEGLKPQEMVVVNHGFPLKSALLISRLGAGCADD
ncbi:MAG: efflux RND transporter periplasmic adaptor subunit [Chloroflexi bacterium]|nr:efflux RND transporter periplasmic adaptor subunit [Chloroflexota bacterium]